METVNRFFEPVHLSDWLYRKSTKQALPDKACAITFDDGWADNHEFAYPILRETDTPATVFLVSDMIGTSQCFWPERLSRLLWNITAMKQQDIWSRPELFWIRNANSGYDYGEMPPSPGELSAIITSIKSLPDNVIHERIDVIEDILGLTGATTPASLLDWDQVREMQASGLIEAGSHTCHHIRLDANTPSAVMTREIVDSKQSIERQTGKQVKTFCFPNGNFTNDAVALVHEHYAGAVTTESGWNNAQSDDYSLSRIGVHEDVSQDQTAFLARLSGWM